MGAVGLLYGVRTERRNKQPTPFGELKRAWVDGPHPLPSPADYGLPLGPASGGWLTVPVPRPPRTAFSLALCISAAAVLVLGLAPRSVLAFAERSILSLLM